MKIIFFLFLFNCFGLIFAQNFKNCKGIKLPDNSIYFGKVKDNLFNDKNGLLNWANGATYIGGFKDGLMDGNGELKFANGIKYKGSFKKGMSDGVGRLTFINGDKYEGYFKKDLFDGIGRLTFKNGDKYEGDFKKDLFNGIGKLIYKNSDFYMGNFKNNKFHGRGIFYFSYGKGLSFEGFFIEDNPIKGTITFVNKDIYNGYVSELFYPHGKGRYVFNDKSKNTQKGIFEYGKFKNK